MILKILELFKKKFPRKDAADPKIMKTEEKPRVKKIVLITIKLFLFRQFFPKMYQKYNKCTLGLMEEHMEIKN